MSRSLNSVQLIGNVGNDPETRTPSQNTKVATFSLATSRQWKSGDEKQEKTEWHRVVAWDVKGTGLATIAEKYIKKGDKIYVSGSIEYSQWKDKEGQTRYTTEIKAREIILLGGNGEREPARATASKGFDDFPAALEDEEDSLPF